MDQMIETSWWTRAESTFSTPSNPAHSPILRQTLTLTAVSLICVRSSLYIMIKIIHSCVIQILQDALPLLSG